MKNGAKRRGQVLNLEFVGRIWNRNYMARYARFKT
jgi:hypothetical protein